ncbi:MAG: hypothetical protein EOO07_01635 [Chitinophagaceae bacterium]|nr:MAG: hypothetical protein EOO07_01635 [Chitinophagaceae bacterium]
MEIKYTVILACLAFAIFLIFKEIKRNDRSRLIWRLLASLLMMTCFVLLLIPVRYSTKKQGPLDELNFYTEKSNPYADLHYHLKTHPEIKKINIYGYGLFSDELKKLSDYKISFHPLGIPSGLISASWPRKIKATEHLFVQGHYHNATDKNVKLTLFGLGTTLDSAIVKANTKAKFSFIANAKQQGRAVFELIAMQDKDTLAAEPVPFEVEARVPIRVLILASFPDFEYKFLKKWLFENQYQVALRSQISKNNYSTEFLNRKRVNLSQINQSLLKDIDVAIIDEAELRPELLNAVNAGMGLIIRTNSIKPTPYHQPLLRDTAGKISVDSRLNGMGKIITTTMASTYSLQLAGKEEAYSKHWSLLLNKSLRKRIPPYAYTIEPQWPSIDEKARLTVSLADAHPPLISFADLPIAPRQNMAFPHTWDGFFWPKITGWSALSINKNKENIYCYQQTDWKAAKNYAKLKATADFVANQTNLGIKSKERAYFGSNELSKWWFFIGFLAAISFLWYEQRFLAFK